MILQVLNKLILSDVAYNAQQLNKILAQLLLQYLVELDADLTIGIKVLTDEGFITKLLEFPLHRLYTVQIVALVVDFKDQLFVYWTMG